MAGGARTVNSDDDDEWSPRPDLLAQLIEASYRELNAIACARAREIVRSPQMAEDIVQDVWATMLSGAAFDPERGPFAAYFVAAVRKRCFTELKKSTTVPTPDDMIEWAGQRHQDRHREEEEVVLDGIANLEARISAALEILKLTPEQAVMLRTMIGPEPVSRSGADSDGDRQARRRLRARVEMLAKLTQEERSAASLMRRHHDLAAAAAAGGITVRELQRRVTSAKRKILDLFNIPGEG